MTNAPQNSPMLASERRSVGLIAAVGSLRMFGLFALLPVLSIFAAGLEGATPLLVGISVGAYGLTQAALQIPLGSLSDRLGRVPVIVAGLTVFAIGSLIAALSDGIYGVILGRFLQGAGAISSTLTALVADVTRPEARTRSMGIYGAGVGSSILLALVFGPVIAGKGGVAALFFVTAALAAAAALLVLLPGALSGAASGGRAAGGTRWRDALTAPLLQLDAYIFLLHAMLTALFVSLPFALRDELDLPLAEHWQLYVAALLLSLIGTVPLIMADDRRGKRWTIQIALLLMLAGMAIPGLVELSFWLLVGAMALFFAGMNFLEAALPARLSLLASAEQRGASLGVFASAQFTGAFFGGVLGGWRLSDTPPAGVFLTLALLIGGWLVAHQLWPSEVKPAGSA